MLRAVTTPAFVRRLTMPLRDTAWYGVDAGASHVTTNALAADTVYWYPLFVPRTGPFRRLAVTIGTSVATATLRLALYDARLDQPAPRNFIAGSMSELDMSLAANTVVELDLGTSLVVPAGWYWAGARGNNAPQPRTMSVNAIINGEFSRLIGQASALSVYAGSAAGAVSRVSSSLPWADPWPAVAPAVTYGTGAPGSVLVAWRRT